MAEVAYLKHLIKNHSVSNDVKKLSKKFLKLKTDKELIGFAKKLNIEIEDLSIDELKEKIAFELIEKCFKDIYKDKSNKFF